MIGHGRMELTRSTEGLSVGTAGRDDSDISTYGNIMKSERIGRKEKAEKSIIDFTFYIVDCIINFYLQ